jgi:hypothetical protein
VNVSSSPYAAWGPPHPVPGGARRTERLPPPTFGYGIAAFGVGPLQQAGLSLSAIFGGTALVAAALAGLSFVVSPVRPGLRQGQATTNVVSERHKP